MIASRMAGYVTSSCFAISSIPLLGAILGYLGGILGGILGSTLKIQLNGSESDGASYLVFAFSRRAVAGFRFRTSLVLYARRGGSAAGAHWGYCRRRIGPGQGKKRRIWYAREGQPLRYKLRGAELVASGAVSAYPPNSLSKKSLSAHIRPWRAWAVAFQERWARPILRGRSRWTAIVTV